MPAEIIKQMDGKYTVRTPNRIHGRGMTLVNAKKQQRLLNAVDHDWQPSGSGPGLRGRRRV